LIDLAPRSDAELVALLPDSAYDQGWGASCTLHVDGEPVFLKRLPLTDVEVANPGSTRNRFKLPTYYSYGVGSAGFGSWREVVAHRATSGTPGFPTLLHERVLPRTAMPRADLPWTADGYVAYWNGNRHIGEYMAARDAATHEVWVLLEHLPQTGTEWVLAHESEVDVILDAAYDIVRRLGDLGIVHFDSHLGNVITDGDGFRMTDFGLAVGDDFELTADERRFVDRHRHYDLGVVVASLGQQLMGRLQTRRPHDLAHAIDHIDDVPLDLAPELSAAYARLRDPMLYMVEHFARMMRPSKRSRYDDATLRDLLRTAGKIAR
jgi:hypothetical protein